MKRQPNKSRVSESGLTLVELMITLALGVILLTAISVLFVNTNKQQVELDKSNRLIDNGRYAMDLMSDSLRSAGFYGEFNPGTLLVPGTLPDPCDEDVADLSAAVAFHVQGFDSSLSTAAATTPGTCVLTDRKEGSDIIVIRRAETATIAVAAIPGADTVYIQGSQCSADPVMFKVGKVAANFDLRSRGNDINGCNATPAPVARYMTEIYFVASNNQGADGIPTLKRVTLGANGEFGTPEALVDGIEFMQVLWGPDGATTDGVPESWVRCDGATCDGLWDTMVSAKLHLLARSVDSSRDVSDTRTYQLGTDTAGATFTFTPAGTAQNFRRHLYSATVRLTNAALRRELP